MNDRTLGYVVISMVVLCLFLPIGYLIWKSCKPVTIRTIEFNGVTTMSFLAPGDAVLVQGVESGVVRSVSVKDDDALVRIEVLSAITLYEDYSVNIMAKGVMGDRYLSIHPGTARMPTVDTDSILHGRVSLGLDDALSYILQLKATVHNLAELSETLRWGSEEKRSVIYEVRQFTMDIDSIIRSLLVAVSKIDTSFNRGIDSVATLLDSAITVTHYVTDSLPATVKKISDVVISIGKALDKVDTMVIEAAEGIRKIDDPEGLFWKKEAASLEKNLTKLQQLIRYLQNDSLTLPVKIW